MKSYTRELWFSTKKRYEFIDITDRLLLCNTMHITASVFYGEFDGIWRKRVLVKIIGE